jgi:hypothetical protein
VLKVPLGTDELGGRERLVAVCRTILAEQGAFLEANRGRGFVGLERMVEWRHTIPVPDVRGRRAARPRAAQPRACARAHEAPDLVRSPHRGGATLDESLRIVLLVLQRLAESRPTLHAHGALKHQNVLLDDRGQVVLSDVVTPTLRRHYAELLQQTPALEPWVAPETRIASAEAPIGTITDTTPSG